MTHVGKTIKYLRKQIPSFLCLKGCTECCGLIFFSSWEWDQVKDKKMVTNITCPYASNKGCDIYEQRPIICRLFGTVPKLKCPYGCGPFKLLSKKKEIEIMALYNYILNLQGVHPTQSDRFNTSP